MSLVGCSGEHEQGREPTTSSTKSGIPDIPAHSLLDKSANASPTSSVLRDEALFETGE
jgi:hypothetical protein